ncbi:MAG: hypothetical protein GY884_08115 [Proteobacteria bacterium]|nr:hypothetical protein [Pseudomonadota bacterium]
MNFADTLFDGACPSVATFSNEQTDQTAVDYTPEYRQVTVYTGGCTTTRGVRFEGTLRHEYDYEVDYGSFHDSTWLAHDWLIDMPEGHSFEWVHFDGVFIDDSSGTYSPSQSTSTRRFDGLLRVEGTLPTGLGDSIVTAEASHRTFYSDYSNRWDETWELDARLRNCTWSGTAEAAWYSDEFLETVQVGQQRLEAWTDPS